MTAVGLRKNGEQLVIASVLHSFNEVCSTEVQKNKQIAGRGCGPTGFCFVFKIGGIACWVLIEKTQSRGIN